MQTVTIILSKEQAIELNDLLADFPVIDSSNDPLTILAESLESLIASDAGWHSIIDVSNPL